MVSSWGQQLRLTLFGESHGPALGAVVEGLPAGEELDLGEIQAFLNRRAPSNSPWSTSRREADRFSILSGYYQGRTTGTPLTAVIANQDADSRPYTGQLRIPRPSHADWTGLIRYQGATDPRGGGHFSGRLTAPLCFAGAVCRQILRRRGVVVGARLAQIGEVKDGDVDLTSLSQEQLEELAGKKLPVFHKEQGDKMIALVEEVRAAQDSVGGMVQGFVLGLPAGLGNPIFSGVENRLASILFGIPAVKGVSFGAGFNVCQSRGSEHNDGLYLDKQGRVRTRSNHDGGINGGITNGMPLVVNVAFKPTPSIGRPQESVDLAERTGTTLKIVGRHDPCLVPRALVAVEAALAVASLDLLLLHFGVQAGGGGDKHGQLN